MKKILVSILMVSLCLSAFSQETSKKGERGPFRTNKAFDNTFIGAAGGVTFSFGDYDEGKAAPSLDIYFGKWWTPQVGARIGYTGIQPKGSDKAGYNERYSMSYIHADLMWNICNAIQGYRSRVWNVMPFIGFGAMNSDPKEYGKSQSGVWYMAGSLGLYNTFTVARHVDITLEGRYDLAKNEFDGDISQSGHIIDSYVSLTAGIAFKLGKVGFEKDVTPDYSSYENTIAGYKQALADANSSLAATDAEIKALEERLAASRAEADRLRADGSGSDCSVLELFFDINSAVLDAKELSILDTYMKTAGRNLTFVITGTADQATGSSSYNKKLSERRADHVSGILKARYGVKTIRTEGAGGVETHTDPVINRTARIVLK